MFRNYSISAKMKFIVLTVSGLTLLLACVVFMAFDRYSYQDKLLKDLEIVARIMGSNCTAALVFHNSTDAQETLAALREDRYIRSAYVYDVYDELFTEYHREKSQLQRSAPQVKPDQSFTSAKGFIVFQTILLDNEKIGTIYIQKDKDELFLRMTRFAGILALVLVGSIFLVLILISNMQKWVVKPLHDLSEVVRHISINKDYTLRVEKQTEDEVGFLVEQFNDMLSAIHDRDMELQQTHDELEQRVAERTIELADINESLQDEIKERKKAEEHIKASLKEKEVLLKEVHHRVKNNLQVISSLLSLQSQHIEDKEAYAMFKESQDRVRSMALVHEKIYQSLDFDRIDFAEYIKSLARSLYRSYGTNMSQVELKFDVEDIHLSVDLAVPCGLVVNELISNALKHAFPDAKEHRGYIEVGLKSFPENGIELSVADNGVGLPEGIDFENTGSLGMQLVTILIEDQLIGNLTIEHNHGAKFIIRFTEVVQASRLNP